MIYLGDELYAKEMMWKRVLEAHVNLPFRVKTVSHQADSGTIKDRSKAVRMQNFMFCISTTKIYSDYLNSNECQLTTVNLITACKLGKNLLPY